ncbi:expressed unknown protein [Seminavis robusta]|uniref:Uncharacterized protein n=1 Tax=Seminavis robusta TaxID=568900 RepID=A0A9N8D947_9STRA|nr:expressed unknown protein [Seminavis robusta]|eukprot:Sro37_g023310.1 n/a (278) ;mRNA; f:101593-102513
MTSFVGRKNASAKTMAPTARVTSKIGLSPLQEAGKRVSKLRLSLRDKSGGNLNLSFRSRRGVKVSIDPERIAVPENGPFSKGVKVTIDPDRLGPDTLIREERMKNHCGEDTNSRVQFRTTVSVKLIPSHRELRPDVKAKLWDSKQLRQANAIRNRAEYMSDGRDWRNCAEENDMFIFFGELIHPYTDAIMMGEAAEYEKRQFARLSKKKEESQVNMLCSKKEESQERPLSLKQRLVVLASGVFFSSAVEKKSKRRETKENFLLSLARQNHQAIGVAT